MIWKLVRRNIAATKGRLILMLLSIVLGVSFVSGSFLLADSLRAVFSDISEQIFQGVDVQVRATESELASGNDDTRFSEDTMALVQDLPDVAYAEAGLFAFEQIYTINEEGEVNRPTGPPVLSSSWGGPSPVSSWTLIDGRAPMGDEIAVDQTQAANHDIAIGDIVSVGAPGDLDPRQFEVVGTVSFGDAGGASAYFNLFDLDTIQSLLGAEDLVDGVALSAADGVSSAALLDQVSEAISGEPNLETVLGEVLVEESNAEFAEFIDILGYILLGFAIVVLFVSIFIIYNTFAILIGQRIRQFGLLRSIGATGRQLTSMVMIEALIIGIVASIIGLFGGMGIATALKWLFGQGGGEFPDGPLIFKARTIVVVFVLGIGVTLGSAILPAFVAQRIPALAALRDGAAAKESSRSRRILFGGIVLTAGILLTLLGLFSDMDTSPRLSALGFGAALLFVGVAMLSVLFASVATRLIGAPIEKAFGLTGQLGRDNASRNPQRTAATATALMIGLALITGVLVLTQSIRATFDKILDETVAADIFVYESNQGLAFAGTAVDQLAADPSIADVAATSSLRVELDGEVTRVSGFDVASADRVLDIKLTEGAFDIGTDGVLVLREHAEELGYGLGSEIDVLFEDDFTNTFVVRGIFDDNTFFDNNNWVFDRQVTAQHVNVNAVGFVGATFVDGVSLEGGQEAAEAAVGNFPQLTVENNAEFKETQEGQLNQIQFLIFGLLGLCIIVAFIGIVNTMALSILERTREIGLLRAVGTSRRQLRSMVRWEAIIVGFFGALLGVLLGLVIGYAAVTAIPDSFVSEIAIPWVWALVFLVLGGALGMLAALFPARRAARMNVLDAISSI